MKIPFPAAAICLVFLFSHGTPATAEDTQKSQATTAIYSADQRVLLVSVQGKERFRYTFNLGGAINGIYDLVIAPKQNLIGESFQGETTDRVIQWTYWNSRYEALPHKLGDGDVRANVTMEGCYHGDALCSVLKTPESGATKTLVFESRIEHWFYKVLDRHGRPKFDTTSRYEVLDDGSLKLTRTVFRHPWTLHNVTEKTFDVGKPKREKKEKTRLIAIHHGPKTMTSYFEGWTPLNRTILPMQSHGRGEFKKNGYQFWQPEELGGWAMAHSDTLAFAVAFGAKQIPKNDHKTQLAFNKLDLPQHRLNILLPAIETNWPENSSLTQSLIFIVGSPSDVRGRADKLVKSVPLPKISER
ncbi:hypothetical protein [Oceaniferula spumae]